MQPNQFQQQRALQVDIQKVIEVEAGMYTRIIADLTRQNAVLSTALQDQENENGELQAKLRAATGGPFTPAPVQPRAFTHVESSAAAAE